MGHWLAEVHLEAQIAIGIALTFNFVVTRQRMLLTTSKRI